MGRPICFGFWSIEYDESNRENMNRNEYRHSKELFYSFVHRKWVSESEYENDGAKLHWYPASAPCKSLKAAKRHIRKHSEIPAGSRFRIVSRFINCDRLLTK